MTRKKAKGPPRDPDALIAQAQQAAERGDLVAAEQGYRAALAADPDHLGASTLLGLLLVERGEVDAAIALLEHARDRAPGFAPIQLAIGSAYAAAALDDLAVSAMETAIKLDTSSTVPLERLARHHIRAKRPREAIGMLRRVLRRDPQHAQARFLLAGLTGDSATALSMPPPAEWITDLFDSYVPTFDNHLVEKLQYDVPRALASMLADLGMLADRSWRVLDLGCGTGLAGVELRASARELSGVDLSPRMIARARQRGVYDELYCEDLGAVLARMREIDLIVAADVFIYVGALEATFRACAASLRPGGLLAFSVERSDGADVVFHANLRYAHAESYIRDLAAVHAYTIERSEPTVLRIDEGRPIDGVLYVLRH